MSANIGVYSMLAASLVGPEGRVAAFEPDPFNAERLRRRVQRNQLSQLHIVEAAVAECASELFLNAGKDSLSSVAMSPREGIPVAAVSLDSYFESRRPPVYVKVDVEGCEEAVVRGASSLMHRNFPLVWQLELGGMDNCYGYSEAVTNFSVTAISCAGTTRTREHSYRWAKEMRYEDNVLAVRDLSEVDARIRFIKVVEGLRF